MKKNSIETARHWLVGGWTTHVKEIAHQIGSFPQILQGENSKNLLKPPPTTVGPGSSYKF